MSNLVLTGAVQSQSALLGSIDAAYQRPSFSAGGTWKAYCRK